MDVVRLRLRNTLRQCSDTCNNLYTDCHFNLIGTNHTSEPQHMHADIFCVCWHPGMHGRANFHHQSQPSLQAHRKIVTNVMDESRLRRSRMSPACAIMELVMVRISGGCQRRHEDGCFLHGKTTTNAASRLCVW